MHIHVKLVLVYPVQSLPLGRSDSNQATAILPYSPPPESMCRIVTQIFAAEQEHCVIEEYQRTT